MRSIQTGNSKDLDLSAVKHRSPRSGTTSGARYHCLLARLSAFLLACNLAAGWGVWWKTLGAGGAAFCGVSQTVGMMKQTASR